VLPSMVSCGCYPAVVQGSRLAGIYLWICTSPGLAGLSRLGEP